jgi:hypothetical protein
LAETFKRHLAPYMQRDPHLDRTNPAYRVNSVYFDSADHRFFWEKVDGVRFRRKVRIRCYGKEPPENAFLEIKQKIEMTTQKRRSVYPLSELIDSLVDRSPGSLAGKVGEEVELMVCEYGLRPKILVVYDRDAYMGTMEKSLRVTFDSNCRYRQTRLFELDSMRNAGYFLHPSLRIVEIKFDNLIPRWLVSLIRRFEFSPNRISKYCSSANCAFFKAGAF